MSVYLQKYIQRLCVYVTVLLFSVLSTTMARESRVEMVVDSITGKAGIVGEYDLKRLEMQLRYLKEKGVDEARMQYLCAYALNNYATFLIESNEWYASKKVLEAAYLYCSKDSLDLRDELLTSYGSIAFLEGDFKTAESAFLKNYEYLKDRNDEPSREALAKTCINLGEIYYQNGMKGKSLDFFSKAIRISMSLKDKTLFVVTLIHMERMEEDVYLQLDMLEQGLAMATENNITALFPALYISIAKYYFRQDNDNKALLNTEKGISFAKKTHDDRYVADGYDLMSQIYARQKEYAMAYSCMVKRADYQKLHSEQAFRNAAINISGATDLILWCRENVKTENGGNLIGSVGSDSGKESERLMWISVLCIILILLAVFVYLYLRLVRRGNIYSLENEEGSSASGDMIQENEELRKTVEEQSKSILCLDSFYGSVNPLLQRIRAMLKDIKPEDSESSNRLKSVSNYIMQNLYPVRKSVVMEEARKCNEAFLDALQKEYPELTAPDRKMVGWILLGMSSYEISIVTGHSPKSVNQARYRLRKGLRLSTDSNLEEFVVKKESDFKNEQSISDNQ